MICFDARRVSHPLVCKQFWAETWPVFIQSSSWVFHHPHDLALFIKSKPDQIRHVQKIIIDDDSHEPLGPWCNAWKQVLTCQMMRCFVRLRGVEIHIRLSYGEQMFKVLTHPLDDPLKGQGKLVPIIRSLQQHRLQTHLTTVLVRASLTHNAMWKPWEAEFRRLLLTHVPLGQSTSEVRKKGHGVAP